MNGSAVAGICLLGALGACNPTLSAESTAPPGRAARLDAIAGFWGINGYRLELSQGIALAVSCTQGGPCEQLVATSDDPAIAEVRIASLGELKPGLGHNQQPASEVVVIGKLVGTTVVHLRSARGGRDVRVTIVPPPLPSATVAR